MVIVGVTGGLGTGKSTVARLLERWGAHRLDADAMARAVIAPGTPGWRAVQRAFGTQVVRSHGRVDRRTLARLVFADPRQRARLNRIIHPRVRRLLQREVTRWQRRDPQGIVVLDVPLLIETGLHRRVDVVVLVMATPQQQVARLQRARGGSRASILQRARTQLPLTVKRRYADVRIDNTGSPAQTRQQVRALWKKLRARTK